MFRLRYCISLDYNIELSFEVRVDGDAAAGILHEEAALDGGQHASLDRDLDRIGH